MKRRSIGIGLGVAALAMYAFVFAGTRSSRVSASTATAKATRTVDAPTLATSHPSTPSARHGTSAVAVSAAQAAAHPSGARAEAPVPAAILDRPPELSAEDLQVRSEERVALTNRWATQSTDSQWSGMAQAKVQELLHEADFSPDTMRDLDCRATICRLQLTGKSGRDALDLLHIARQVHDETWLDHHEQSDGSWSIEVYFSRPGYRLSGDGSRIEEAG